MSINASNVRRPAQEIVTPQTRRSILRSFGGGGVATALAVAGVAFDSKAEAGNHPLIATWANALSSHNISAYLDVFTTDVVLDDVPVSAVVTGRDQLMGFVTALFTAIPDFYIEVTSSFRDGNMASVQYIQYGTPASEIAGIPATGGSFAVRATSVFRLRGNRIAQETAYWDLATLKDQIGAGCVP